MSEARKAFDKDRAMAVMASAFRNMVPFNAALDLEALDCEFGVAVMRLPWRADLVGNPVRGVLHGGAITALVDACSGASVFFALPKVVPIATLDLRIDYLKPATPHLAVTARAECYRVGRNVAFTRAIAYHDDPNDPIASSAGTFMIATKGDSVMRKAGA